MIYALRENPVTPLLNIGLRKFSSWMYEKQLQGFICSLIYL